MPELEPLAHEAAHTADPTGRKVGILAAMLAVALAITSIMSHRAHTAAILDRSAANDQWAHYQSTRVKYHNLELGENLLAVLEAKNGAAQKMAADYAQQKKKYAGESSEIQANAERAEHAAESDEKHALHYDIGEGFFEISVVLTSLYFISRKLLFPVMAIIAGALGTIAAITTIVLS